MKYNWAKYNKGDGVIKIIVEDETGKKEAIFTVNQSDKATQRKIGLYLKEKYGIDFTIYGELKIDKEKGFFDM